MAMAREAFTVDECGKAGSIVVNNAISNFCVYSDMPWTENYTRFQNNC